MLLQFVAGKKGDPSQITFDDLTVERVATFLQYLETGRRNQSSTRNLRLSAIHSFFHYVGAQCPEHLAQVQRILSVPSKRSTTREIQHLSFDEIQAVLGAIDRSTGPPNNIVEMKLEVNLSSYDELLSPDRIEPTGQEAA